MIALCVHVMMEVCVEGENISTDVLFDWIVNCMAYDVDVL